MKGSNYSAGWSNSAAKVSDIGEFGLISRLLPLRFQRGSADNSDSMPVLGLSDDCAVIRRSDDTCQLACLDSMVENIHFRRDWSSASDVAHKLLATNASDIASMGGSPQFALLSLGLPPDLPVVWVDEFFSSLASYCQEISCQLIGGDTVSSPVISLSLSMLGETRGTPLLRDRAKPGDDIWVSGVVGAAYLGLELLFNNMELSRHLSPEQQTLFETHQLRPSPRLALGLALCQKRLSTCAIDISDGLLQDALHIAESSKVLLVISEQQVPLAHKSTDPQLIKGQLSGGEDYELLFTTSKELRAEIEKLGLELNTPLTRIGHVVEASLEQGPGISLGTIDNKERFISRAHFVEPHPDYLQSSLGYVHFRGTGEP